jgi:hypothetical protein
MRPHPTFFNLPLAPNARLVYCILERICILDFLLHRLQHLPAMIHAEKEEGRANAVHCFTFRSKAAFLQGI